MSDTLLKRGGRPNLPELHSEYSRCGPNMPGGLDGLDDVRFSNWPGQTADGKKHKIGKDPAWPWDGASDCRSMVVDDAINDSVALMVESFWRSALRPKAGSDEGGRYGLALTDHLLTKTLTEELLREVELSAQYKEHCGWYVLHAFWDRRIGKRRETVKLDQFAQMAAMTGQTPEAAVAAILDPLQEEQAVALVGALYEQYLALTFKEDAAKMPALKNGKRLVRELRQEGKTTVPIPVRSYDGPRIVALRPWDEVFLPPDTTDLQNARVVFQREFLTEETLRGRILEDEYDEAWVEAAVKHKGAVSKLSPFTTGNDGRTIAERMTVSAGGHRVETGNEFIEVVHAVYRAVDEDGVPCVYRTIFHPSVGESAADQADLVAAHHVVDPEGDFPYVVGAREYWCRRLTSSRGVPEIAATDQNAIKSLRDAIVNRTDFNVLPPINEPESGPLGGHYQYGPAMVNKVRPGREPEFMKGLPSGGMTEAFQALEMIQTGLDNRFGRPSENVPAPRWQALQSRGARNFLMSWSKAIQQALALCQKLMDDAEFSKITGAPEGWLEEHRGQSGLLGCSLHFDIRDLDQELTLKRIEAVNQTVLPSDVTGAVNRPAWVALQMAAINPVWAKELIVPQAAASQQIWDAVRMDVVGMFQGNEPRYVENDPTAETKLKNLEQIVAGNPIYQTALQEGGRFKELIEKYFKNLKHSVDQEDNKQNGRIGVKPGVEEIK